MCGWVWSDHSAQLMWQLKWLTAIIFIVLLDESVRGLDTLTVWSFEFNLLNFSAWRYLNLKSCRHTSTPCLFINYLYLLYCSLIACVFVLCYTIACCWGGRDYSYTTLRWFSGFWIRTSTRSPVGLLHCQRWRFRAEQGTVTLEIA